MTRKSDVPDEQTRTGRPTDDRAPPPDSRTIPRRQALRLAALGIGGVAGCSGDRREENAPPETADATAGRTATETPVAVSCDPTTTVEGSGPLFAEFDARAAFRCLGEPFDSMEELDRWTVSAGSVEADERRAVTGTQAAYLAAATDDDRVWMSRSFPGGVDLSDRNLSLAVHGGLDDDPAGVYVQLLAPDADNRVEMWHAVTTNGWFRMDPGPTEVVGDPDLTAVEEVGIGAWAGDAAVDLYVDSIRTTAKPDRGLVAFTFDDNLASQYDVAFPALEERGFPATVGVIPSTVGSDGRTDLDQLRELQSAGWDVVNHPQVADPLPALPAEEQRSLIERTKRWLLEEGFEDGARFAIWPYGAASRVTLDIASDYYYVAFGGGRTTSGVPATDPLTVTRVDGNDVERTKRLIEFAAEYRTLAVPMYHPIGTSDAVSAGAFAEVVELVDELDLSVVTASELWDDHFPSDDPR
jgi:peptidoglycan/xylan/chitin deacetylase (PgdA/CDA1 family)